MPKHDYTFELSPEEIAGIFMSKGWKFSHTPIAVLPKHITDMVERSVNALVNGGGGYAELGRFVVFKDAEFPGGFEVLLKVGYVNANVPEDMDAPNE